MQARNLAADAPPIRPRPDTGRPIWTHGRPRARDGGASETPIRRGFPQLRLLIHSSKIFTSVFQIFLSSFSFCAAHRGGGCAAQREALAKAFGGKADIGRTWRDVRF